MAPTPKPLRKKRKRYLEIKGRIDKARPKAGFSKQKIKANKSR